MVDYIGKDAGTNTVFLIYYFSPQKKEHEELNEMSLMKIFKNHSETPYPELPLPNIERLI